MKCPHCSVSIKLETEETGLWLEEDYEQSKAGYEIAYGHCPDCDELIVLLRRGLCKAYNKGKSGEYFRLTDSITEEVLYPKFTARKVESEVPKRYAQDFIEACSVLALSAKASAALSRRILQDILREHFNICYPSLAKEIDEFINRKDVPSFLTQAVDAVRNVGNFAAHPLKDTNTGEVMDVEPGEAEWLLDVLEALFDFSFVQPIRLQEKKNKLNEKLQSLGKPPMKSK